MAVSKKTEFSKDETIIADLAKAIAHPARIRILQKLAECKACVCGELVDLMPLSQSTVSQHLKELKKAGLIKGEIEGPKTCYCLDHDKLKEAGEVFRRLFNNITCC